jgi:hypothetical protein
MNQQFLYPGATIELVDNAHTIPAGRYTFITRYDELLVLSVSAEIGVVLATSYWGQLVRLAPPGSKITSEARFLEGYSELLANQRSTGDALPQSAISMCFMGPKARKRLAGYLSARQPEDLLLGHLKSFMEPTRVAA